MPETLRFLSSWLAVAALAFAFVATLTMVWRFGKVGAQPGEKSLWAHRITGYAAAVLLVLLFGIMWVRVAIFGADFAPRTTWHAAAGVALAAVLLIKWAVVRPYRNLLKYAQPLGLTLFAAAFVVVALGAGAFLVGGLELPSPFAPKPAAEAPAGAPPAGTAAAPEAEVTVADHRFLFAEKCGLCHSLRRPFQEERTPAEWDVVVARMQEHKPGWISDGEASVIKTYIINDYGPGAEEVDEELVAKEGGHGHD
jgi:hypothetical protein